MEGSRLQDSTEIPVAAKKTVDDGPQQQQEQTGTDNNSSKEKDNNKKRKRDDSKKPNHFAKAYENIQIEPRISQTINFEIPGVDHAVTTTRPGSPSRQFANSYSTTFVSDNSSTRSLKQVIHQHANGLCVVTAGLDPLSIDENSNTPKDIEFLVSTSDPCSAGERRKRQSKMLKKGHSNAGGSNTGMVTPETVLAKVHLQDGTSLPLYAFCWGSILELNTQLTVQQLQDDPIMKGYLAVILPTGPFPPKECIVGEKIAAADEDNHGNALEQETV
jgi:hypothetical protein